MIVRGRINSINRILSTITLKILTVILLFLFSKMKSTLEVHRIYQKYHYYTFLIAILVVRTEWPDHYSNMFCLIFAQILFENG